MGQQRHVTQAYHKRAGNVLPSSPRSQHRHVITVSHAVIARPNVTSVQQSRRLSRQCRRRVTGTSHRQYVVGSEPVGRVSQPTRRRRTAAFAAAQQRPTAAAAAEPAYCAATTPHHRYRSTASTSSKCKQQSSAIVRQHKCHRAITAKCQIPHN